VSVRINNPFPYFYDKRGLPLDGGTLYLGADGVDPELTPGTVWLDSALTVVAPQPISVIGGIACHDGNPAQFYITGPSFSIRTRQDDGAEVFYEPSAIISNTAYQPLDSDLTAIAALTTTAYGRSLLTAADATAARALLVVPDPVIPTESICLAVSDETTALTAGTGKLTFRMPYALTLTSVKGSLTTAQVSGALFTVDINEGGTTILSTKLSIDNTEKTSTTAATAAVISDTALAADAEITIDIDAIGDGTAKGLKIYLIGKQP
jgi:hypothetical protein